MQERYTLHCYLFLLSILSDTSSEEQCFAKAVVHVLRELIDFHRVNFTHNHISQQPEQPHLQQSTTTA